MENTGKVLFEDETPQWYIALGERWVGPLSAADVYQKVLAQEVSWAHFVWKPGQADWKRMCDVATFQVAVPTLPAKSVQQSVREASKPGIRTAPSKQTAAPAKTSAGKRTPPAPRDRDEAPVPVEEKSWFLFYNDAQFGPFSTEEISRFLRVGKIHGRVFVWKDGMADWVRLETVSGAGGGKTATKTAAEKTEEKELRNAPRRPLVAKIFMANQDSVIVAVCRDISVGGMQVLTDRVPGQVGARIKMNVSPAGSNASGDAKEKSGSKAIEPFVAEGMIVRILEDGRGFSFRFEKLPESSRKAIESYIQSGGA
jgi:hypothetical protein